MNKKEVIRRSISLPKTLDERIGIMTKEYSYNVKNELMMELLELGILKFNENVELTSKINLLIDKVEKMINVIEKK